MFNATRRERIEQIVAWGYAVLVDDLTEVFAEPDFPADVSKILFAPSQDAKIPADVTVCASWANISGLYPFGGTVGISPTSEPAQGS